MGKRFTLIVASFAVLTFTALVACKGDDAPSTFDDQKFANNTPGDNTPPGTFVPDGGASGDAGKGPVGPTTCAPKIPDPFNPTWAPPTKAEACDATELADYYDKCLTDLTGDAAVKACADWRAAHAACTTCIEPTNGTGPIQWSDDRKLLSINIAGCVSIVQNDTTTDGCAASYGKAVECTRDACDWCIEAGGAYTTYQSCQTTARGTGVCATLETARQSKCAGITGTSGTAKTCFPAQGDTEKDHFVRVEGIFCAKP